ncbi:MAG: hypothetical protein KIT22_05815 [Verrucomicrobiae bacterium]|nr:hypothetical protein [Verrucomicrobiae bacterium]
MKTLKFLLAGSLALTTLSVFASHPIQSPKAAANTPHVVAKDTHPHPSKSTTVGRRVIGSPKALAAAAGKKGGRHLSNGK